MEQLHSLILSGKSLHALAHACAKAGNTECQCDLVQALLDDREGLRAVLTAMSPDTKRRILCTVASTASAEKLGNLISVMPAHVLSLELSCEPIRQAILSNECVTQRLLAYAKEEGRHDVRESLHRDW